MKWSLTNNIDTFVHLEPHCEALEKKGARHKLQEPYAKIFPYLFLLLCVFGVPMRSVEFVKDPAREGKSAWK